MKTLSLIGVFLLEFALPAAIAAENPPVPAAEAVQELEAVTVTGHKDPAILPYRKALKALDAFDLHHALAPAAPPRFALRLRPRQVDPGGEPLTLHLVGNETDMDIPLAADHSFSLPRDQKALDEGADLIANRKKGLYFGAPHIRSPGVPADARRLGDLRLECEMNWAVIKDEVNFVQRLAAEALGGLCHTSLARIGFRTPRALAAATLVAGERREALAANRIGKDGETFMPPLHDRSWPDDTLIEFVFAAALESR